MGMGLVLLLAVDTPYSSVKGQGGSDCLLLHLRSLPPPPPEARLLNETLVLAEISIPDLLLSSSFL